MSEAQLLVVPDDGRRAPLLGADLMKKLGLKLIQNPLKPGQKNKINTISKDEEIKTGLKEKPIRQGGQNKQPHSQNKI